MTCPTQAELDGTDDTFGEAAAALEAMRAEAAAEEAAEAAAEEAAAKATKDACVIVLIIVHAAVPCASCFVRVTVETKAVVKKGAELHAPPHCCVIARQGQRQQRRPHLLLVIVGEEEETPRDTPFRHHGLSWRSRDNDPSYVRTSERHNAPPPPHYDCDLDRFFSTALGPGTATSSKRRTTASPSGGAR